MQIQVFHILSGKKFNYVIRVLETMEEKYSFPFWILGNFCRLRCFRAGSILFLVINAKKELIFSCVLRDSIIHFLVRPSVGPFVHPSVHHKTAQ